MNEIKSVLELNKLVFDKIEFKRFGFKNENEGEYEIEGHYSENTEENIYKVTLLLRCNKKDEYKFDISLTGFFSFDNTQPLDKKTKEELISKNSIAILMPYMRSQVSLLTAQPEVDCVVLPPFNINNFIEKKKA